MKRRDWSDASPGKEHQETPEAQTDRKDLPLEPSEDVWSCQHLGSDVKPPAHERIQFCYLKPPSL